MYLLRPSRRTENEISNEPKPLEAFTSFKDMGLHVNEKDQIVNQDGSPFKYSIKPKEPQFNQERFSNLCQLLSEHVGNRFIEEFEFKEYKMYYNIEDFLFHPNRQTDFPNQVYSRVLHSKNALNQADKLVVLIQNHSLSPWFWNPKVCIESGVKIGSMIEISEKLMKLGYEILCCSPNENDFINGKPSNKPYSNSISIPNHQSPEQHVLTVFEELIFPSNPKQIYILAHGYGTSCVMDVLHNMFPQVENLIQRIFMIQSIHSGAEVFESDFEEWFLMNSVHWLESNEPEEDIVQSIKLGCQTYSAGSNSKEGIVSKLMPKIIDFFQSR